MQQGFFILELQHSELFPESCCQSASCMLMPVAGLSKDSDSMALLSLVSLGHAP